MLSEIMWAIGSIVITLIIFGTQKYLSTRKSWQLGAVIPLLSIIIITVLFYTMHITLSMRSVIPCMILVLMELLMWLDGRHQYRNQELIRMKAQDI